MNYEWHNDNEILRINFYKPHIGFLGRMEETKEKGDRHSQCEGLMDSI
jgi:hypothetical protein